MVSQEENIWETYKNIKDTFSEEISDSLVDSISDEEESFDETSTSKTYSKSGADSISGVCSISESEEERCLHCTGGIVIPEEGRMICQMCGVDHGPMMDHSAEWRYYGSNDNRRRADPTRCGMPSNELFPDSTPSTVILGRGTEVYRRLHKWNQMTYKEKSLISDFNEFRDKCLKHNIPVSVIDKTKALYKALRYDDELYDMKRGTTKKGLMAACAYESCRLKGISKSPKEIAEIFEIKVNKVTNGIKDFKKLMHCKDKEYAKGMRASTPKDYIDFFGNKIGLEEKHIKATIHIAQMADMLGIVPENIPHSMAVGCLFLTITNYQLEFTKKYVANQCQISEVTISKTCKKLEPFKKYLFPKEID